MSQVYTTQKITKNLYQLGLVSLVIVVIWVVCELYYTYTTPIEVEKGGVDLTPLNNELYIETAEKLQMRDLVPEVNLDTLSNSPVASSSPQVDLVSSSSGDLF